MGGFAVRETPLAAGPRHCGQYRLSRGGLGRRPKSQQSEENRPGETDDYTHID